MYALRLEPDFINNLTPEGRRWLARAVVNMINIDGKLDPNEMPYMHDAVILIDESERAELLENAQQRNRGQQIDVGRAEQALKVSDLDSARRGVHFAQKIGPGTFIGQVAGNCVFV